MDFTQSLYLEHLEELSFLYDRRCRVIKTRGHDCADLEVIEKLMEPHIDALVIGGNTALDVCGDRCAKGDPGELYGAVRVFCRLDMRDQIKRLAARLDSKDQERGKALADALCHNNIDKESEVR